LRPPTADQIRAALRAAGQVGLDPAVEGQATTHLNPAEGCPPGGAVRADRPQRAAGLPPAVRGLHRQLLRHFASTGTAPTPDDLAEVAAADGVEVHDAMRRLADEDLVALDDRGRLRAAYPFSPTPTAHVVQIGGLRTYAMCAIDALGVPAMVGRDATITSTDPHTGSPIVVTVVAGRAAFDPHETVVVYAASATGGRSVDTCCSTINFFASPATAQSWIDAHPGLAATILEQDAALALGRDIFSPLLHES
jgi:hypothetical protein